VHTCTNTTPISEILKGDNSNKQVLSLRYIFMHAPTRRTLDVEKMEGGQKRMNVKMGKAS
jgi:hypothetical protein